MTTDRAGAEHLVHARELQASGLNKASSKAEHGQTAMLDLSFLNEAEVDPAGEAKRIEAEVASHVACQLAISRMAPSLCDVRMSVPFREAGRGKMGIALTPLPCAWPALYSCIDGPVLRRALVPAIGSADGANAAALATMAERMVNRSIFPNVLCFLTPLNAGYRVHYFPGSAGPGRANLYLSKGVRNRD
jgi:hypothetical protein